jgi:acetyl/propionyl-CoA carboxylase alpha subunit
MNRVLLAGRGELTMRLVRYFRERGIETVTVFSEPEVEQPWVDEADYSVYLNGSTVEDTYLNAQRIIGAAHDAGCTVIHPGYCFFAERADFVAEANAANLRVISLDRASLERVNDRWTVRAVAEALGIPVIPAMPVPEGEDGLEEATEFGLPIYVKAVAGGVVLRVDDYDALPQAVAEVRRRAQWLTGQDDVYLSAGLPEVRQLATTVVRESGDRAYALGQHDKSVQVRFRSWIEELGPEVVEPELAARMSAAAVSLIEALEVGGIVRVRFAVSRQGGFWLLGVSGRLTTGYSLTERVFDVDLIDTQVRLSEGEPLGWEGAETVPPRHGIQLRLLHVDPSDGISRPDGVLERLELPAGVFAEIGVAEGQACTAETEPLIASLVITGPTRHATLVKARAALEHVVIEGVVNNLEVLRQVVADADFWRGTYDVHMVDRYLGH